MMNSPRKLLEALRENDILGVSINIDLLDNTCTINVGGGVIHKTGKLSEENVVRILGLLP